MCVLNFMKDLPEHMTDFNSIMEDFAVFSRHRNLFLPTRLLFRNLVPFELQLTIFHLFFMDFAVFLQVITARESLGAVEAFVGLDS